MEFETVYKVKNLHTKEKDGFFLTEGELKRLNQDTEKYKLLSFLKTSSYHIFHDFPAIGASVKVFNSSDIEGPFDSPPKVKERIQMSIDREYCTDIIKKFFPADKVPESFEEIDLVNYGTRTEPCFARFIYNKLDKNKVIEVGKSVVKKLEKICGDLQKIEIDGCIVEFSFSEKGFFYPNVNISVFGLKNKPREIITMLGLYELRGAFESFQEFGLNDSTQRGLAYNFLIQKNSDIGKLLEAENIII